MLLLSNGEEKSLLQMSDMIWHYRCLMGGVSAASARGIRTGTAGAVCLNLNLQLHLLQSSTSDSAWQPPLRCEGEDRHKIAPVGLSPLVLEQSVWTRTQTGKRGLSGSSAGGFRARRLTDCPLWDDGLIYPPLLFQVSLRSVLPGSMINSRTPGSLPAAFPKPKTTLLLAEPPRTHWLTRPLWSLRHDILLYCKTTKRINWDYFWQKIKYWFPHMDTSQGVIRSQKRLL